MVFTRRLGALVAVPVMLMGGMSGCALFEPAGSSEQPSALQQCAMGHNWSLDLTALSEQVTAALTEAGVATPTTTATGSQTFEWQLDGRVTIESDYELVIASVPGTDQALTVTESHRGSASGQIFINGEVAIPRNWDGTGFTVETTAELNGEALEELPYVVPPTDFDDGFGLELTCEGGTLTTHPRGGPITQTWTKSD